MSTEDGVIEGGELKDGQVVNVSDVEKGETAAPKVESVEVEVGGVKVSVPKVFVDQYADMQRQYAALSGEIQLLKGSTQRKEESTTDDPLANFDVELFANPKAAAQKLLELARAQVLGEVQHTQTVNKAQEDFWSEFYKQNKELDKEIDGDVISSVLNREYGILKDMKVPEAIKHLATKSKEALLKIAQKRGGKGPDPKPNSEGGNESGGGRSNGDKSVSTDKPDSSLSSVIRARREARMNPARKKS